VYPRNAASPPRLAIGPVVQISDGAVQTAGVAVKVIPQGGTESAGAGTVAYSADGAVLYTPTQGETDYVAVVFVASKTGCIPASVTVVTTASATAGYAGVDWSKVTAATSAVALTNTTINTSQVVASVSGAVGSVTSRVTANVDQWGGVAVTGMPLPTASYTAPDNATIGTISINLATVNNNVLSRLAASSYVAPLSASETRSALGLASANLDTQLADIPTVTEFEARTILSANYATATNQTAIKSVTDKLNTGLVQDGAVYQFTANMLELTPGGGGGGSATIENQELILANLDNITGAVSAAVARLQLETQITGFPATICRGSDYDQTLESEIRLQLLDLEDNPITEIGGTPVDEITWLFGLGTDRQPRLVAGACSWDGTTDELVIELAAGDTDTTPLGSVTWQIGAQIGELVRWLGGGTTRIVERQFTA